MLFFFATMTFQVQRLLGANGSFIGNRRTAINIILKTEDILIFFHFVGYLLLLVMMHCRIHECCPTRFTLMSFTCVSLAPPPSHLRPLTSLSCVFSDSYTPPPSVANLIYYFFFFKALIFIPRPSDLLQRLSPPDTFRWILFCRGRRRGSPGGTGSFWPVNHTAFLKL